LAEALGRFLASQGLERIEMTPARHPRRMKEIHEKNMRLYWLSPRQGRWTGVFEFRYYNNEMRERWGYADEALAIQLSRDFGEAWRLEVLDGAGFWLYAHYAAGEEKEGKAYQDTPADRTADPGHARYELNRIIEREGFRNIGLGYEHIPGPAVAPIEHVPQSSRGIEGYEGFTHLAFARKGDLFVPEEE
jgi:hypothetical protein